MINRQIGYDSLRKSLDDVKSLLDRDEVPDTYFRKMFISVRKHLDRRIIDLFSQKPSGSGPVASKGVSVDQYNNVLKENEELRAKISRLEDSKIDTVPFYHFFNYVTRAKSPPFLSFIWLTNSRMSRNSLNVGVCNNVKVQQFLQFFE